MRGINSTAKTFTPQAASSAHSCAAVSGSEKPMTVCPLR